MSKQFIENNLINEDKYIEDIVNKMDINELKHFSKKYLILVIKLKKENIFDLSKEMIKCNNTPG